MGFYVENRLIVVVEIEVGDDVFVEFPNFPGNALNEINLTESTKFTVPTLFLSLEDTIGFFDKYPLLDGQRIRISLSLADSAQKSYTFRIFSHRDTFSGNSTSVAIDGYLDCPTYWFTSSCAGVRGSTSEVISKIAERCGMTSAVSTTQDSQLWMQGNMTNAEFVQYLTKRGFSGTHSYMVSCVYLESMLVYRDVNNLPDSGYRVSLHTLSEGYYYASDYSITSNSGLNNGLGGYASMMREQRATVENEKTINELNVKTSNSFLNLDQSLARTIGRSQVFFSCLNPDVNQNLWQGLYQNNRYSKLFTVNCNLVIVSPTDLRPLCPFQLSSLTPNGDIDSIKSGTYITDTRSIVIRGSRYVERITATRLGYN